MNLDTNRCVLAFPGVSIHGPTLYMCIGIAIDIGVCGVLQDVPIVGTALCMCIYMCLLVVYFVVAVLLLAVHLN